MPGAGSAISPAILPHAICPPAICRYLASAVSDGPLPEMPAIPRCARDDRALSRDERFAR